MGVEASFSGGNGGLLVEFLDFDVELVEDGAKRARQAVWVGKQGGPVGPKDSKMELGVEESRAADA